MRSRAALPPLSEYATVRSLVDEMLARKQIAVLPLSTHTAFAPKDDERWRAVQKAHDAIDPMFWGARVSLLDACAEIRDWLDIEVGP